MFWQGPLKGFAFRTARLWVERGGCTILDAPNVAQSCRTGESPCALMAVGPQHPAAHCVTMRSRSCLESIYQNLRLRLSGLFRRLGIISFDLEVQSVAVLWRLSGDDLTWCRSSLTLGG